VSRLWTDRDFAPGRSVFSGISGEQTLDSVALYHRIEHGAAQWARRRGGAVVELHAYAADRDTDATELTRRMWAELRGLWPETKEMAVLDVEERVGGDAPAFEVGSDAMRPGVRTDAPGLHLAGDWVKMPFPSALMERAAASAVLATNAILHSRGARPAQVWSVPTRGLLTKRA
jgi:isorenieratene synthase